MAQNIKQNINRNISTRAERNVLNGEILSEEYVFQYIFFQ